jgi:hypothetical protein
MPTPTPRSTPSIAPWCRCAWRSTRASSWCRGRRSSAWRIASSGIKRVELDFSGIQDIGQAFADELFRVFANAHPEIVMTPLHTEPAVASMIRRAVAARESQAT